MERQKIDVGKTYEKGVGAVGKWTSNNIRGIFNVLIFAGLVVYLCYDFIIDQTRPTADLLTDILFRLFITMTYWSNMYYSGVQKGHLSDSYIKASVYLSSIIAAIRKANKVNEVDSFCVRYIKDELDNYRRGLVESVGIGYYDEYCKYYQSLSVKEVKKLTFRIGVYATDEDKRADKCMRISVRQKHYIIMALRARPRHLNFDMLMGSASGKRKRAIISASESTTNKKNSASKIIRYIVCAVITAVWAASPVVTASASVIGTIGIMLLLVAMASIGGWTAGYKAATENAVRNFMDRADVLTIMCEQQGVEIEKKTTAPVAAQTTAQVGNAEQSNGQRVA